LTLGSAGRALGTEPCEEFLTRNRRNATVFHIVVPAVECFPREDEVVEKIRHDVFDQLIAPASGGARDLLKLGLYVGSEMHFHGSAPSFQDITPKVHEDGGPGKRLAVKRGRRDALEYPCKNCFYGIAA
jgi:hypothetical protein